MITGFNHNFTYQKFRLHIQTEDCGVKKPRIETHLFRDGIIVATRKTSYDDILKVDDLGKVVEELMKDQHRDMLRRLKKGDYDNILGVVRNKNDEAEDALEILPEELELDELALEALAPAAEQTGGNGKAVKEEIPEEPLEITEVIEIEEVDLEAAEESEKEVAEKLEPSNLTLEDLVMNYFLGDSGKGLKGQVL